MRRDLTCREPIEMPIENHPPATSVKETKALRARLFRETSVEAVQRVVLRFAWALKHYHVALAPFAAALLRDRLSPQTGLPDPERTGADKEMAGFVHDLSVPTLLEAYKRGLYTSDHYGPLTWSSPAERCVLSFHDFHIGKDVRRLMRQGRYHVSFDQAFERVIKNCATARRRFWQVTWITPRIMRAYAALYDAGYAHSYEVWNAQGELVGGGYGLGIGRIFFGESQFFHERNASKIASTVLMWHLARWGFLLADAKNPASAMRDLGFRIVPREQFQRYLAQGVYAEGKVGRWSVEADTQTIAAWNPKDIPLMDDAATLGQDTFDNIETKNPSVSVPRGVINRPSLDNLAARVKSIARSPIIWLAMLAGAVILMLE
jgi:leucyl/phenylalanyl-tRNA--protein transferase